jgi:hypothetical protein
MEEWRDVPGIPHLQVSSLGNARTLKQLRPVIIVNIFNRR